MRSPASFYLCTNNGSRNDQPPASWSSVYTHPARPTLEFSIQLNLIDWVSSSAAFLLFGRCWPAVLALVVWFEFNCSELRVSEWWEKKYDRKVPVVAVHSAYPSASSCCPRYTESGKSWLLMRDDRKWRLMVIGNQAGPWFSHFIVVVVVICTPTCCCLSSREINCSVVERQQQKRQSYQEQSACAIEYVNLSNSIELGKSSFHLVGTRGNRAKSHIISRLQLAYRASAFGGFCLSLAL